MRLFLAQAATLYDYPGIQAAFTPCMQGRWRPESSLHATLLFLGDRFPPERVIDLVRRCDLPMADAYIKGIERFSHNRILYAASEHPTLVEGHRMLSSAFEMQPHGHYIPHVTLMRYKKIETACFEKEKTTAEAVIAGKIEGGLKLMRSTLTPAGAVYDTLYAF
ncbi:2'-5' RNA ligase family protein [Sulfurimonas diazotrophicus]|uniref:2'-5' RNA ligase family protein n=1 Tax=Sulfurimonas diazotrophicus TaxID=3131939 RepID=A0ABZ3H8D9_9BACT